MITEKDIVEIMQEIAISNDATVQCKKQIAKAIIDKIKEEECKNCLYGRGNPCELHYTPIGIPCSNFKNFD